MVDEQEWQDILGSGAIMRKIVKTGAGPVADRGNVATISATLELDGKPVYQGKKIRFRTGEGDVATALDVCVPLMRLDEVCEIKSSQRFDKLEGANDDSEILYTVTLEELESSVPLEDMDDTDRVAIAAERRALGNNELKAGDYHSAVATYNRALAAINKSSDNTEVPESLVLKEECLKLYNNLALAYIKLKEYKLADNKCEQALKIDPRNLKSLNRKLTALLELEQLEEAQEIVQLGLTVNEEMFRVHEVKLRKKQKAQDKASTEVYRRMMQGLSDGKGPEGVSATLKEDAQEAEANSKIVFYSVVAICVGVFLAGVGVLVFDV
eukprot:TRINITY_DN6938_c0_g1_i1.p1 TRINITY_DN6938_c0_g1~~TRINITY_DN6938_c0_g1_i1.p1  ORF type:complete len:325 (+),score=57.85 TRINITY_DN6938_c0_g1_i1:79-1053(+)